MGSDHGLIHVVVQDDVRRRRAPTGSGRQENEQRQNMRRWNHSQFLSERSPALYRLHGICCRSSCVRFQSDVKCGNKKKKDKTSWKRFHKRTTTHEAMAWNIPFNSAAIKVVEGILKEKAVCHESLFQKPTSPDCKSLFGTRIDFAAARRTLPEGKWLCTVS